MPDVTLDLGNQYIGSAYSPQVAIAETETGHEIDFTFADSEHPGQTKTEGFEVPNYASEEAAREAAEAARAAAESARVAAEEGRMNRELDRVFNENARINAEELREDAETARASAEQARAAAETARASAESSRASAEQARTSAESARASAEAGRAQAESARVSAEQARATAENARAAAESARVTAEQARQTNTAAAIQRADAATSAANTAASSATDASSAADAAAQAATSAANTANVAADTMDEKLACVVRQYGAIEPYLYKRNVYIDNNGDEQQTSNGYATYKIPVAENDLLHIKWSGNFWNELNPSYALRLQKSDGTYVPLTMLQQDTWFYVANSLKEGVFLFPNDYSFFVITAYEANLSMVSAYVNEPGAELSGNSVRIKQTACAINDSIAFRSKFYFHNSQNIQTLGSTAYAYWIPVKSGDKVVFDELVLTYYGTFHPFSTGTTVNVTAASWTAPEDGILCEFPRYDPTVAANATLVSADSVKIDASNVVNDAVPSFDGLKWVSFGDSITYRESWQPYVIDILGMSHVNCGIGSTPLSGDSANAFWQDVRLNAIKAANPDIVTILGGANDLTMNPVIGTDANLADKDTSTFIGAYSYIIDNLLTWKPSLRIFVLSTTWAHDDGATYSQTVTYGQFAEACKTVAEYYKLPFVDLYDNSGFNKYTMGAAPNNIYSEDRIHPNDSGGRIIASQVIAKMREVMLYH